MKILLANYRFFVSGGPERYMFNVIDALTRRGHKVIPFSIQYALNQKSPYTDYFVKPLGSRDEVYFRQQKLTPKSMWRSLERLFYAKDVEKASTRLAKDQQVQVAYVLHYLRKLSPSLLTGLKKAGLPIVVRLSDFGMMCPEAHFLRDDVPCELCIHGNLFPSLKYRCVQESYTASALNLLATSYHQRMQFFNLIDVFVTPTMFMYWKMVEAGYAEKQLCHIPTFVNKELFHPGAKTTSERYIAYVGRLDRSKGVHVLIDGFARQKAHDPEIELTLEIAGSGDEKYLTQLKSQTERLGIAKYVRFHGKLPVDEIVGLLNKSYLTIVPSLWYENLPNAVLESYACGTPVLASNLGSLAECVDQGQTGYLFNPGDARDLADRLSFCFGHPEMMTEMGRNARKIAETKYSEEQHLEKLEAVFNGLLSRKVLIN